MERLTDPKCYYAGYMGMTVVQLKERLTQLGKYEDAGLTPEEVNELACCGLNRVDYLEETVSQQSDEITQLRDQLAEKEALLSLLPAFIRHGLREKLGKKGA